MFSVSGPSQARPNTKLLYKLSITDGAGRPKNVEVKQLEAWLRGQAEIVVQSPNRQKIPKLLLLLTG